MDEYREALQKLSDAVEDTMREHYKELGCCSVTRARLDEAKELLARPHIDWEGRYRFLIENRESVEPAAAEKAREWRPISEAERQTQYLLYAPPESIHRNPRGKPGQYRVSSPQSFVWASHFMPLPSPPAATGEASTPIPDEPDPEETSDDPPRAMDFIPPHLAGGCA